MKIVVAFKRERVYRAVSSTHTKWVIRWMAMDYQCDEIVTVWTGYEIYTLSPWLQPQQL